MSSPTDRFKVLQCAEMFVQIVELCSLRSSFPAVLPPTTLCTANLLISPEPGCERDAALPLVGTTEYS